VKKKSGIKEINWLVLLDPFVHLGLRQQNNLTKIYPKQVQVSGMQETQQLRKVILADILEVLIKHWDSHPDMELCFVPFGK
jgi:hypothetical protein